MPRAIARRLTDEQRELAAQYVGFAVNLAGCLCRRRGLRRDRGEIVSAALSGLCDAAARFVPGRGVHFTTYAKRRVAGAILDAMRMEAPKGFRKSEIPEGLVGSIEEPADFDDQGRPLRMGEILTGRAEDPAELIDQEDRVRAICRCLPPRHREVIRLLYCHAGTATMKRAGTAMGVGESRVSQMYADAMEWMRNRINTNEL